MRCSLRAQPRAPKLELSRLRVLEVCPLGAAPIDLSRPKANGSLWIYNDLKRKPRALITDPDVTLSILAAETSKTERSIRQTLSLAFLDPAIVREAAEGRLPRGFGIKRLMDLPMLWQAQGFALGLDAPHLRKRSPP